eukprot:Hpha_TRINITY_DN20012_c0_g1::TRINITY_DN20012_c0_g1_i1::g.147825::m.147825
MISTAVLCAVVASRAAVLTTEEGRGSRATHVRYSGRHFPAGQSEGLLWSSTGVACAVRGATEVYANVTAPQDGARLRSRLNDTTWGGKTKLKRGEGPLLVPIATTLDPAGTHTVMLTKVSEDNSMDGESGVLKFHGFVAHPADTASFVAVPPLPERKLEFIGDSDTAGFCTDGKPGGGDSDNKFEDSTETWAAQLAAALGAQTMVEAVSGWGVTKKSTPIQPLLPYADGIGGKHRWDSSQWVPDAVVILIGPNDYVDTDPKASVFIRDYTELLSYVNSSYSQHAAPKVIHVCGGSGNGFDPCANIEKASNEWNAKGSSISSHYVAMNKSVWNTINKGTTKYNGCDGHYSPNGHHLLEQDILPAVKGILKW